MDVVLLAVCVDCPGSKALKEAAIGEGYHVEVERVVRSDVRTFRSVELGFGLPVLVREDGAMSDDGKVWVGKETRVKKTNPVVDVVDSGVSGVDDYYFE